MDLKPKIEALISKFGLEDKSCYVPVMYQSLFAGLFGGAFKPARWLWIHEREDHWGIFICTHKESHDGYSWRMRCLEINKETGGIHRKRAPYGVSKKLVTWWPEEDEKKSGDYIGRVCEDLESAYDFHILP